MKQSGSMQWVKYLLEVGNAITRRADEIALSELKISQLESEIRSVRADIADRSTKLQNSVSELWTDLEITVARRAAKEGRL